MPPRRPAAPTGPSSGAAAGGRPSTTSRASSARPSGGGSAAKGGAAAKGGPAKKVAGAARPRTTKATTRPTTRSSTALRSAGRAAGVRDADGRLRLVRPVYAVAGVLALLTLLILPDLNRWLVQRSQISEVHAQNAQAERDAASLQAEADRWQDPAYVRAQARERLRYVLPGETGLVVRPAQPAEGTGTPAGDAARTVESANRPWFGDLWESVKVAGGE